MTSRVQTANRVFCSVCVMKVNLENTRISTKHIDIAWTCILLTTELVFLLRIESSSVCDLKSVGTDTQPA
uniref:Ovule protein n=1 Tax=Schistosoma curassoni TaxID=6186 RepID=A0A183KXI9_9TREM